MKSNLLHILKIVFAVAVLYWLFRKQHLDLAQLTSLLTPGRLVFGLALMVAIYYFASLRWALLLASGGVQSGVSRTFPLVLIGLFFGFVLPGAIGGDVVKGYYLTKDFPTRKVSAVTSLLTDRLCGLYSMVTLATISVIANWSFIQSVHSLADIAFFVLGLFLAISLAFLALSHRFHSLLERQVHLERWPLGRHVNQVYTSIGQYRFNRPVVLKALAASFLSQILSILFIYSVGEALGETELTWATYLFAAPLGFMTMVIPISPAGIGVGQVAFLFLFRLYAQSETNVGQTAITLYQGAMLIVSLAGVYFYLRRKRAYPALT